MGQLNENLHGNAQKLDNKVEKCKAKKRNVKKGVTCFLEVLLSAHARAKWS